jgi:YHS domain-containing protein
MVRFDRKRRQLVALTALLALGAAAHAGSTVNGADKGPALQGHDAVAYFTDGKPTPGDARFTHEWNGATWRFASQQNLDRFRAEPGRYAPQYGGYCAFAMSGGAFSPGDAKRWRIEGGKLYLNANVFAQTLWERDIPKRVADADGHWPIKKQELEAAP